MIALNWGDTENKVLIWNFSPRWSSSDFLLSCQKSEHMIKPVDHPVNILVNLSQSRFHPSNLFYLVHTGLQMRSKNKGKVVVFSESKLWLRVYQHIVQIYSMDSKAVQFATSLHEAMQLLGDDMLATTN